MFPLPRPSPSPRRRRCRCDQPPPQVVNEEEQPDGPDYHCPVHYRHTEARRPDVPLRPILVFLRHGRARPRGAHPSCSPRSTSIIYRYKLLRNNNPRPKKTKPTRGAARSGTHSQKEQDRQLRGAIGASSLGTSLRGSFHAAAKGSTGDDKGHQCVLGAVLFRFIVLFSWNHLMPEMFNLPSMRFREALGATGLHFSAGLLLNPGRAHIQDRSITQRPSRNPPRPAETPVIRIELKAYGHCYLCLQPVWQATGGAWTCGWLYHGESPLESRTQ